MMSSDHAAPRWAVEADGVEKMTTMAQTPTGEPAFWAVIVLEEAARSNLPEELLILGKPREADGGRASHVRLGQSAYHMDGMDVSWSWSRDGDTIHLYQYDVPRFELLESELV